MEVMYVPTSSSDKFITSIIDAVTQEEAKFDPDLVNLLITILERMNLYLLHDNNATDRRKVFLRISLPKRRGGGQHHNVLVCTTDQPKLYMQPDGYLKCERLLCILTDTGRLIYFPLSISPTGDVTVGHVRGRFATPRDYRVTEDSFFLFRETLLKAVRQTLDSSVPWTIKFKFPLIRGLSDDEMYEHITGDYNRTYEVSAIRRRRRRFV